MRRLVIRIQELRALVSEQDSVEAEIISLVSCYRDI